MALPLYVKQNRGYVLLISVIIIGAVATTIAVSLLLFGAALSKSTNIIRDSYQALALADSCAEEALQQIHDNTAFVGSNVMSFAGGNCQYNVANLGGANRSITATGTIGIAIRRLNITATAASPKIQITTWQEY